ncbi:hypothetical protein MPSEU_000316400 [Mayamaea pseudoterrestris]|nr:hypothetical protein MPSEU_000316400 [Mayamaea pseudoterrestris]
METAIETPEVMKAPPSRITWNEPRELRYAVEEAPASLGPTISACCFHCKGTTLVSDNEANATLPLLACSKCQVARYCQKECQVLDWKKSPGGHKQTCHLYQRVGPNMLISNAQDQEEARNLIFARIRFYACPYAVNKTRTLGRGFLMVQSSGSLALMSLLGTRLDSLGRPTPMRSVLLHFLTMGEYDRDVCRDDFEMTIVRSELQEAVNEYDEETQVVLLMKFRCGHLVVGVAPLVPDYGICTKLGMDYFASNESEAALQLNLDDM